jgi:hypothetical protein
MFKFNETDLVTTVIDPDADHMQVRRTGKLFIRSRVAGDIILETKINKYTKNGVEMNQVQTDATFNLFNVKRPVVLFSRFLHTSTTNEDLVKNLTLPMLKSSADVSVSPYYYHPVITVTPLRRGIRYVTVASEPPSAPTNVNVDYGVICEEDPSTCVMYFQFELAQDPDNPTTSYAAIISLGTVTDPLAVPFVSLDVNTPVFVGQNSTVQNYHTAGCGSSVVLKSNTQYTLSVRSQNDNTGSYSEWINLTFVSIK